MDTTSGMISKEYGLYLDLSGYNILLTTLRAGTAKEKVEVAIKYGSTVKTMTFMELITALGFE